MEELSPLNDGMITIHKLISRSLSVSVLKCDEYIQKKEIPAREKEGFVMYLTTLIRVMHAHHRSEDEIVFPYFTGKIDAPYDSLQKAHVSMAAILDELDKGLDKITINSLPALRNRLDVLQRSWVPHIKDEELSFRAEVLTGMMSGKEQKELVGKIGEHGAKSSGPGPITLPFLIYNLEDNERKSFLKDFPWILKYVLIPVVWRSRWKPMDPFLLS